MNILVCSQKSSDYSILKQAVRFKNKKANIIRAKSVKKAMTLLLKTKFDLLFIEYDDEFFAYRSLFGLLNAQAKQYKPYIVLIKKEEENIRLNKEEIELIGEYLETPLTLESVIMLYSKYQEYNHENDYQLIEVISMITRMRDYETSSHLERIKQYVEILCRYLNQQENSPCKLNEFQIKDVVYASMLHDVGKIGIADRLLKNPSGYSLKEREEMKVHTTKGYEILNSIHQTYPHLEYLNIAASIALNHHEHYDGSGYPSGLKGEQIPIYARIVTLADVFDALTSERVYKQAYSFQKAKEYILSESGKIFDPMIVNAFAASEKEFERYSSKNVIKKVFLSETKI